MTEACLLETPGTRLRKWGEENRIMEFHYENFFHPCVFLCVFGGSTLEKGSL